MQRRCLWFVSINFLFELIRGVITELCEKKNLSIIRQSGQKRVSGGPFLVNTTEQEIFTNSLYFCCVQNLADFSAALIMELK